MDAFEVLQATIAPSIRAANEQSGKRLAVATELADRNYQERLTERRRQQAKSDEAESRKRVLRNQLSALMPSGVEVDPNMSEEALSSAIAERTRARTIQYDNEDKKRALEFELNKANQLAESQLRRKAEEYGVPYDPGNLSGVRSAIAEKAAKEKLSLDANLHQYRIDQARSSKDYQSLRNQLASIEVERDSLTTQLALPEPMFDPNISPAERSSIYNEIARTPAIIDQFAKMKDGAVRLMALQRGDVQSAFSGIKEEQKNLLVSSLTESVDDLSKRLLATKSATYQAGVKSYIERLRTLPQRLNELDRRRNDLFKIGDGTGVDIGLALRMEDPDVLTNEYMMKMQKAGQNTLLPGMPKPQDQASPTGIIPLPAPGQFQGESTQQPQRVKGLIERGFNAGVNNFNEAFLKDPVAIEGARKLASGLDQNATHFGNNFRDAAVYLFGGVPSTNTPPMDFEKTLQGGTQLLMSPFSMLGRGMRSLSGLNDADNGQAPVIQDPTH